MKNASNSLGMECHENLQGYVHIVGTSWEHQKERSLVSIEDGNFGILIGWKILVKLR